MGLLMKNVVFYITKAESFKIKAMKIPRWKNL